jgi:hypothetical protein
MNEQGQQEEDPNIDFDEKKLYYRLIYDDKWDAAIKFLDDDRLTGRRK